MRTTTRLCLVLAVVATAGLVAIPATANAKAKNSVSKKALNKKLKRAHNRISTLRDWNFGLAEKNNAQDEDQAGLQGTVNAILGGVPAIVGGLQALEAALKNEVAPGLLALKSGLETLGGAYVAVEYGVAKVTATNGTVAAGGSITSADVPDDGNQAVANGTAIVVATGSPVTIDLKADIRSNEEDNDSGDTVGQAGGFVSVTGTTQSFTDNDNGGGDTTDSVTQRANCIGAPTPPGIIGTVAGESIVTPSGTVTNLPIVNLPGGLERTDTTHPDSSSKSLLNAATCTFAATPGSVYEVYYNVNFLDVPTSTTPGGTE